MYFNLLCAIDIIGTKTPILTNFQTLTIIYFTFCLMIIRLQMTKRSVRNKDKHSIVYITVVVQKMVSLNLSQSNIAKIMGKLEDLIPIFWHHI